VFDDGLQMKMIFKSAIGRNYGWHASMFQRCSNKHQNVLRRTFDRKYIRDSGVVRRFWYSLAIRLTP